MERVMSGSCVRKAFQGGGVKVGGGGTEGSQRIKRRWKGVQTDESHFLTSHFRRTNSGFLANPTTFTTSSVSQLTKSHGL